MVSGKCGKSLWLFLALVVCLVSVCAVEGATYGVPGDFGTIQGAISDNSVVGGDVIVVSVGSYQENLDFLGKAITVTSTDPNDPNIVASTILDGSAPVNVDVGSVVTFKSGEGQDSVLTGFTITGGTGSWIVVAWEFKGLRWNRCGGGVLCYNLAEPSILKNVFVSNSAGQGGGIYIYGDPGNSGNPNDPEDPVVRVRPIISGNTFTNNSAIVAHGFSPPDANYPNNDHGDGGAIVGFQGVDATITNNVMENNLADLYGGGIHLRQWSHGVFGQNHVVGNTADLGGGIHLTYTSSPLVTENLIEWNVVGPFGGGGIYVILWSNPTIQYNVIQFNTSPNGGGVAYFADSQGIIHNNTIVNNNGDGIYIKSSHPIVRNNTIVGSLGGIRGILGANPLVENNIVTSNGQSFGMNFTPDSTPIFRYNNVWDNPLGNYQQSLQDFTGMEGNISVDPQFVDSANGDYHLFIGSDCVDAGDPNADLSGSPIDFDGDGRLNGERIDIGVDEVNFVWNITAETQYNLIQSALDAAIGGDVIVLAPVTFSGAGNRDLDFLGKPVTLRSIDPGDSEVVARTILDVQGSVATPHRGINFHNEEDANSVVDGFSIINGYDDFQGGAIVCAKGLFTGGSSPTIRNMVLKNNTARSYGGAISCRGGSSPSISYCVITENMVTEGYGAGISCFDNCSPRISHCVVNNNVQFGVGRHGGGILCWDGSNAVVSNCIVSGNIAQHRGGGLYAYWSDPTFINCTVIGNIAEEGGGLCSFREANPTLINCIMRQNRSSYGPEAALINTSRVWEGSNTPTRMTISHSNIEGGIGAVFIDPLGELFWDSSNIEVDPNFSDPGFWDDNATPGDPNDDYFVVGDYHLTPGSGCVDVGDTVSLPVELTNDVDGESRISNVVVDMGADEFFMPVADIDGDGRVNTVDLELMSQSWLGGGLLDADLDQSGSVDWADFSLMAQWWFWQGAWVLP